MRRFLFFITLAYPLIIHFLLLADKGSVAVVLLILLCLVQIYLALDSARLPLGLMLTQGGVVVLCVLSLVYQTSLALFLPPVYIGAILFFTFFNSLQQGREAIISRFARVVFDESDPHILAYTRQVTWLWCIFFLCITLEGILLPFLVSLETWSLFVNLLNYLFVAILFIMEFAYRRLRFKQRQPFFEALKKLRTANYRELLG